MEFSDVGCHCHFDLCRQHTFLPLQCGGCNYKFCKKHINKTDHQCTQIKELASKQIKSNKKNITYKCTYNGCKKKELIDIKCKQCKLTFCLSHRFSDSHDCTGPIKKDKKPKKQDKNQNIVIQNNTNSTHLNPVNRKRKYEEIDKPKTQLQSNNNALTTFKQNDTIQLINLQSRKDWNGQFAVIIGPYRQDKNRWPVKLIDDNSQALIKPQNMKLQHIDSTKNISESIDFDETESHLDSTDEDIDDETVSEIESSNNDIYDYITVKAINLCRLNQMDFKALLDDIDIDDVVASLYVRIEWVKSEFRVCKIEKTMNYRKSYVFMDMKVTKGVKISQGGKIWNKKLNKISNDDFTFDEINLWKQTLEKHNVELPAKNALIDMAETVDIIKKTVEIKLQHLKNIQQEYGSHKDDVSSVNNNNLQKNNYLKLYIETINSGSNCFWCIPQATNPSRYTAFLLMKNHQNDKNLIAARNIAQNQRQDAIFTSIREYTLKHSAKKGYCKSKGWLIDCKDPHSAYNIYTVLSNFMPHTFGDKTSNFCRIVLQEFGDAYMNIQLLTNEEKKKLNIQLKKNPSGPKYNYEDNEPTIDAMIEYFSKHVFHNDTISDAVSLINNHN
eukprot:462799_1